MRFAPGGASGLLLRFPPALAVREMFLTSPSDPPSRTPARCKGNKLRDPSVPRLRPAPLLCPASSASGTPSPADKVSGRLGLVRSNGTTNNKRATLGSSLSRLSSDLDKRGPCAPGQGIAAEGARSGKARSRLRTGLLQALQEGEGAPWWPQGGGWGLLRPYWCVPCRPAAQPGPVLTFPWLTPSRSCFKTFAWHTLPQTHRLPSVRGLP